MELEKKIEQIGAVDLLSFTQMVNGLIVQHEDAKNTAWRIRMPNTAYNAGDKVIVPGVGNFDKILRCETAGTTADAEFPEDYNALEVGSAIPDGTVEWGVCDLFTMPDVADAPVASVNGKTGDVVLTAQSVGADSAGTAVSKVSAHNSAADAHKALFDNVMEQLKKFLPLTGGTMTGSINYNTGSFDLIKGKDSNSRLILRAGTDFSSGATFALSGINNATIPGGFALYAHDGTNSKTFFGSPEGGLFWDNKQIERVNSSGTNYIRYENGLQICFGLVTAGARTFPVAFKDTNYSIVISDTGSSLVSWAAGTKTTTGFTAYASNSTNTNAQYIAIGKWK